ncbi:MAG: hypothetical protein WCG00_15710, partial [Hyphomicrobiales bacterium]
MPEAGKGHEEGQKGQEGRETGQEEIVKVKAVDVAIALKQAAVPQRPVFLLLALFLARRRHDQFGQLFLGQ